MERRRSLTLTALSPLAAVVTAAPAGAGEPGVPTRADAVGGATRPTHTFGFAADGSEFLLDGRPFQIRAGEIHPARVPVEQWRHRIRMAKALGLNTLSVYDFWNYHEMSPGTFDFRSERRDLARFVRLAQSEGMWVLLRPGPYVCGEWELGGIPARLLADPDAQLRVRSEIHPPYMKAFRRYARALAAEMRPLMLAAGGPILMVQVENEYGSYGDDATYLDEVRQAWVDNGLHGPFYTEDGLGQLQSNHTDVPGGAIALSGGDVDSIAAARRDFPGVPVMSGELYSGWLTHWGDRSFASGVVTTQLEALMAQRKSFNLYMFHGGTSFGFWSGANAAGDGSAYQPDITSYDYGSPVTEQGIATDLYLQYRGIIQQELGEELPPVPAAPPVITPEAVMPQPHASVWDNLPQPVCRGAASPQPMEAHGQDFGLVLYRTHRAHSGDLQITSVHDYATVFLDGVYQGGLSRAALPAAAAAARKIRIGDGPLALQADDRQHSTLDVLVEGMGRINYGHGMVDRKGITSSVTLSTGNAAAATLSGWDTYALPLSTSWLRGLEQKISDPSRAGQVFRAALEIDTVGDTYLDLSQWAKGHVWVNGHHLGRYWEIGPQLALFCPSGFLRRGRNEILVLDLHVTQPAPIAFVGALTDVEPPSQGGVTYRISTVAGGKVLEIPGGSTAGGATVALAPDTDKTWQHWEVIDLGTGYSTILNRHTGLALDNLDHQLQAGNRIGQWADGGGTNQQWALTRGGDATYTIRNRETGFYLTALGTEDGGPVTLEELTGDSSSWNLVAQ